MPDKHEPTPATLLELEEARTYVRHILRTCAPQCEPLSTLSGMISQLDNYIAGLQLAVREASLPEPEESAEPIRCNICDQPIQHELVCEDCLSERGFVHGAALRAVVQAMHMTEAGEYVSGYGNMVTRARVLAWADTLEALLPPHPPETKA